MPTTSKMLLSVTALLGAAWGLSGAVHTLRPGGADDTEAVQSALSLCTAEPDCVVDLQPGVFKTRQIVVKGFRGVIHGAGMDNTFVEPAGTLRVPEAVDWQHDPSAANPWPVLWSFVDGDISISGIAFRVRAENPTTPYTNIPGFPGPKAATHLLALLQITGERADSAVDQCKFEGAAGTFPEGINWPVLFNLHMGVSHWRGPARWLEGSHSVTSNQFLNAASGHQEANLRNGRMVIGGGPTKANVYSNACNPMQISALDNVKLEVSYNFMQGCPGVATFGILLEQAPADYKIDFVSSVLIANNYVKMYDGFCISVADYVPDGGGRRADFLISGNVVESLKNAGGITVVNRTAPLPAKGSSGINAVVSQNRILGSSGRRGILIGGARRTAVLDNDVSEFKSTLASYYLQNSFNTVVSGASGTVDISGAGADTHTLIDVTKN